MSPWYDCCERLLLNTVPIEKKTPLYDREDIIEKMKARLNDPDDEPWLESTMKGAKLDSDITLGRLYGELMGKRHADIAGIFQSALDKGHVLWAQYQMDPGKFTIKFIDHSIIVLTEPMPVQNLHDIWMAWYREQFDESLSDMNQFLKKEKKESMNTNCLDTVVHYRNGSGISVTPARDFPLEPPFLQKAFDCKISTIPEVKLIQRRGRCTIVKWQDGTETKVVLEEGKPDTGIFGAYCIALAKKCAGSTEKLLRTIDDHDERVLKCRHLAKMQELREKRMKKAAEERKLKWEEDVAAAMYDSRVRDEAIKRLWAKEEKEEL